MDKMKQFLGLYINPKEFYSRVKEKPSYIPAIITIFIVCIAQMVVCADEIRAYGEKMAIKMVERIGGAEAEQMSQLVTKQMDSKTLPQLLIDGVVAGVSMMTLALVMAAVIMTLSYFFRTGKERTVKFKHFFSMTLNTSAIIAAAEIVVSIAAAKLFGQFPVDASLSILLPESFAETSLGFKYLVGVISGFTIYRIWAYLLLTNGLALFEDMKYSKAAIITWSICVPVVLVSAVSRLFM